MLIIDYDSYKVIFYQLTTKMRENLSKNSLIFFHHENIDEIFPIYLANWQFNSDGYHVSPTHQRTPLVPRDLGEDFSLDLDGEEGGVASGSRAIDPRKPKNAKWVS